MLPYGVNPFGQNHNDSNFKKNPSCTHYPNDNDLHISNIGIEEVKLNRKLSGGQFTVDQIKNSKAIQAILKHISKNQREPPQKSLLRRSFFAFLKIFSSVRDEGRSSTVKVSLESNASEG